MASKSVVAKNRFHKGVTAAFRKLMRNVGISFDEEQAQFIIGGIQPFAGEPSAWIGEARDLVLAEREEHMREWKKLNPERNPFPPSFPTRVLGLVRTVQRELSVDTTLSPDGILALVRLEGIAIAETKSDPFGPPDDFDPFPQ